MNQPIFSELEYQDKKRKTRREVFLERMDGLIPWQLLEERIHPCYPKAGRGRHPYLLPVMLRVHYVQLFYNLSDPGMEDLLYESDPVRQFVGLKLSGPLPDETTILNFRHLLERHQWRPRTPSNDPRKHVHSVTQEQIEMGRGLGAAHNIQATDLVEFVDAQSQPFATPIDIRRIGWPFVAKIRQLLSDAIRRVCENQLHRAVWQGNRI